MNKGIYLAELKRQISILSSDKAEALSIIPWASPVLFFGSVLDSAVATLGLNPSNLEFVDKHGQELIVPNNRFETLRTLKINSWKDASDTGLLKVINSYDQYFSLNGKPYNQWFKKLDKVIIGLGVSFYNNFFPACHLDLVPFATSNKWSSLSLQQRNELLAIGIPTLSCLLQYSCIRILILNGVSVVKNFEQLAGVKLSCQEMPDWVLNRENGKCIKGYAYKGRIKSISDSPLNKEILILGYSHNIQSSYGITTKVIRSIRNWIVHVAKEQEFSCEKA